MAHRRVKDVDYDEDDLYDYDDEAEELSPEDKKQLQDSIVAVRQGLASLPDVTEAEISETVWHYYFDVPKSIAYLQKKHTPSDPKPAKKAAPSRFDEAALHAQQAPVNAHCHAKVTVNTGKKRKSYAFDLFQDIPWLNVPVSRRGNISVVPSPCRGGLLGGSEKPTKMAALLAARKKAKEEKARQDIQSNTNSSIALLDRLRLQPESQAPDRKGKSHDHGTVPVRKKARISPSIESESPPNTSETSIVLEPKEQSLLEHKVAIEDVRIRPSTFAATLLGHPATSRKTSSDLFSFPYPSSTCNAFAGPSPDDIVTTAQAKGTQTSQKKSSKTDAAANGLAELNIRDGPAPASKTKSKNINVVAEYEKSSHKNAANFVVIGHVDHGKSTLMGRLLYDLKLVNERSYNKMKTEATNSGKASFALAWVMDATSEERTRGVTVDIATNHFETAQTRFTILDAPGHRDFIPNMIAGTAQADFAVLVIDASTNAFEAGLKGQTKEHALLARSMGISRLVIAVNKMDAAGWSEARFTEILQQTSAFLLNAGFQASNLVFVPCAGLTGINITTAPEQETVPWYKGSTLVAALEGFEPAQRAVHDPLRLTINDVFRGSPQNPLSISGRIDAGTVQPGDHLLAMPASETATVRAIEIDGEPRDWAVAGQIATLHLEDIDVVHLRSGDIICSATRSPIHSVQAFSIKVLAFEHVMPGAVELHKGRMHAAATITQLTAVLNKASGAVEKKKPRIVKPGALARLSVRLESPLPLEAGGRVVLRSEGTTVAAGLIESVEPATDK